jgi:hypothetical protein
MNANYFTTVLLPLHIKLQGLYREKCGDWRVGDEWYQTDYSYSAECDPRGIIEDDERAYGFNEANDPNDLKIPRTIDDSSPEASKRSLWGMTKYPISMYTSVNNTWSCCQMYSTDIYKGKTPTEAILKALIAQENLEVG